MTDLKVRLLLEAEASAAKAALAEAQAAVRRFGDAAKQAGVEGADGAGKLADSMDRAGARAAAAMSAIAREGKAAGQANVAVAGSAAGVAAQFNDIGVMWAAGQSPFITAIQQGTQLTQIMGGQGLTGAAAMARGAFATMFNPFSIGLIAALTLGGTFVQWLTGAGEEAKTLEERLAELVEAQKGAGKSADEAAASTEDLTAKYGAQAEAVRELLRVEAELAEERASRARGAVAEGVLADVNADNGIFDLTFGNRDAAVEFFEMGDRAYGQSVEASLADMARIDAFLAANDRLRQADGLEAQIAAADELLKIFGELAALSGKRSEEEAAGLAKLTQALVEMRRAKAEMGADAAETASAARAGSRNGDGDTGAEIAGRAASRDLASETAELRQQAGLQALILQYGEDSVQVALARRAAERAVVEAMLATSGAADDVKAKYLAAWDAANLLSRSDMGAAMIGTASSLARLLTGDLDGARAAAEAVGDADLSSGINAAIGAARGLLGMLQAAAAAARSAAASAWVEGEQQAQTPGTPAYVRRQYELYGPGQVANRNAQIDAAYNVPRVVVSGGGSGGGGGAARDSVAGLRAEAAETLRELDLAVAAIGEKVRAGLATTAEAAEGVAAAKDRAGDELAELIAQLATMGPAGQAAADELRRALDGLAPAANRLSDALEEGFKAPFADFVSGAASAKDAFADFAGFIQRKLGEIVANQVWDGLIAPLLGGLGGGGLGGGLELVFGGLFGGGFAAGGAPLSALANQVVGRPTLFAMGDGRTGLLGEAGDEAILPLRGKGALALLPGGGEMRLPLARGASGDLGIALPPGFAAARPLGVARPEEFGEGQLGVARPGELGLMPADLLAAVQPFARGGAPRIALPEAPDLPRRRAGPGVAPEAGPAMASPGPRKVSVTLHNNGAPMQAEAEMRDDGGDVSIDILMDQIDAAMARRVQTGRGAFIASLQRTMGLRRQGQ